MNWIGNGDPAFKRKNIRAAIEGCEATLSEDVLKAVEALHLRY